MANTQMRNTRAAGGGGVQNVFVHVFIYRFSSDTAAAVVKLPIMLISRDRGPCLEVVPTQLLGDMLWSLLLDCSLACCEHFGLLFTSSSADALALSSCLPWAPVHTPLLLLCEYEASSNP